MKPTHALLAVVAAVGAWVVFGRNSSPMDPAPMDKLTTGRPQVDQWAPMAWDYAGRYAATLGLDRLYLARLILCFIAQESDGDVNAIGDGGLSVGLTQIYLSTARGLGLTTATTPDDYQAAHVGDADWALNGCCVVLGDKLRISHARGKGLAYAVMLYNGPQSFSYLSDMRGRMSRYFGESIPD